MKALTDRYHFVMRVHRSLKKGLLIALILMLLPASAVSAQKVTPGSSCKVLNQKVVYQTKSYTCIKSGKKLVWNKGVAIKIPTPTPTPIPTPTPTPTPIPTPTLVPIPTPTPTPTKDVDDVQKVVDDIRKNALTLSYSNTATFKFVFQAPTSIEVEEKTKRSLMNAIPVFAKLGFPITDGLILVSKDDAWLREELIRYGCNVNFTFPQSTGFYVSKSCQSGKGAVTSKHWDVMKFSDGLDGLYFNHTLPHEYFHQIQSELTGTRNPGFPKWFSEGSAQFFTNQAWVSWNPQKSYVDWHTHWWTDLNPNYGPKVCKNASISMMSDPSTPGVEGICAYSKGQLIVEFLVYKYGLDKYREFYKLNNSPDWRNFNQVFKTVTNDDLNDFYAQVEQFMVRRGW
jgi:hypothetical protein